MPAWEVGSHFGFAEGLDRHQAGFMYAGVTAARWLTRPFGVDFGISRAFTGSRIVRATTGATTESFDSTAGTITSARLRGRWGDRAAILVAAGPAMALGGSFGNVPLASTEVSFESRPVRALVLRAGWVAVIPVQTSRPEIDPARCLTPDCPSRFAAGHLGFGAQITASVVF